MVGIMMRVGGLIGGLLLVVMGVGGSLVRGEDSTMYWVLSRDGYDTTAQWYFMLFDSETGEPLRRVDTRIENAHSHFWWSSDGEWLFYQRSNEDSTELMRVRPATGNPELVLDRVKWRHYEHTDELFSPDGQWMVVVREIRKGDEYGLTIANGDGEGARELVPSVVGTIREAFWSPDSDWIYYIVSLNSLLKTYRINVDGSGHQLVYDNTLVPRWSPNGEWFAFHDWFEDRSVSIMRADGSETLQLLAGAEGYHIWAWLESDRLLLDRTDESSGITSLYVMEPTGNDRPRLIVENFNRVLSITPDWETLLLGKYSFNMGCVLLTARVETGETDCLVESETFYEISGSLTSPRWTLFEVVPNTQASEHPPRYMMVAERDGSGLRQLFDISRREDSAVHLSIMPDDEWVMYSELYYLAGEGYQGYQRRVRISDGTEALLPRGFHVSVSPPIGAGPVD